MRPLGTQAAVAARQLIASIGDADREIAELARNVEPGEEERLVEKIESLAGVPSHEADYAPLCNETRPMVTMRCGGLACDSGCCFSCV